MARPCVTTNRLQCPTLWINKVARHTKTETSVEAQEGTSLDPDTPAFDYYSATVSSYATNESAERPREKKACVDRTTPHIFTPKSFMLLPPVMGSQETLIDASDRQPGILTYGSITGNGCRKKVQTSFRDPGTVGGPSKPRGPNPHRAICAAVDYEVRVGPNV